MTTFQTSAEPLPLDPAPLRRLIPNPARDVIEIADSAHADLLTMLQAHR